MPLSIEGELDLSVSGSRAHLSASGVRLDLRLDRPRQFLSNADFFQAGIAEPARVFSRKLHATGLSMYVHSQERLIVLAGKEAKPGWFLKTMGFPMLEIRNTWSFVRAFLAS